ncbi:hypothetical protein [Halorussus litoreus]|uniref:hypothetical protein n=1 Tax=Halorussus litoreus TaxID=1710536 RepID=UPI0018E528BD|nr:hypothetical protein [Halorussus litoreus]
MTQHSQQPTGGTQGMGSQMGGSQMGRQMGSSGGMGGQQMGGQMSGQQMGGQTGASHQTTHQQVGQQFESELTPELNQALEAFDRVVEISSWCADKCIESGPQMAECARLCLDLAEVAELNEKLIARDSINGPEVAETFLIVAQQGLPVLEQHQQSPHVQETLESVYQAIESTNRLLNSIGGQQGFQEMAQQMQGQQPQGQQFQGQQPQSQQYQGSSQGQVGQQSQGQFPQSY